MKSLIIAAPGSGSGKTTITIGIMETMRRRGLTVAPFKVGPDFIDPGYHHLATGRISYNLDGWICSPESVKDTFDRYSYGADIAVVEGVMGLFDGIDGLHDDGSTAQIAKIIGAPVILVVDARSQARSVAALVKGYATYDPDVWVRGVIFNNVGSDNHARILRDAVEALEMGIPVIGCIPTDPRLTLHSRHLGLVTAGEQQLADDYLDHLVGVIKEKIDFGLIWAAGVPLPNDDPYPLHLDVIPRPSEVRIAVARDMAFCFVYEPNLIMLREAGAELVEFSPLTDTHLPENIQGLYLPGGYPELFVDQLSGNSSLLREIRRVIRGGLPTYAECGGFIYLTQGVRDRVSDTGAIFPLVGIFPVETSMLPRRKALGYREIELTADTLLGKKGTIARGHEFHYSEMTPMPAKVKTAYQVRKHTMNLGSEGYQYKNCLASYVHLHFGSNPEIPRSFVGRCQAYRKKKQQ